MHIFRNFTRTCHFRESHSGCMVGFDFFILVLVGLAVDRRLCSRDPSPRKLCGLRAVAIRLLGLSPTMLGHFSCHCSVVFSCIQLDSDATPSIGRRRVACSCSAGAVFLARSAVLRRSGYPILLWDHFLGVFSWLFFHLGFQRCKRLQIL